jgi:signal transduction histidine kinase
MNPGPPDSAGPARDAEQLTRVSRAFTDATSLQDILRVAADQAADLLDASKAVLMLVDDDGMLRVRAAFGIEPELVERFRQAFDESIVARLQGLFGAESPDSFVGVPLIVQGRVTGLLAVMRSEGQRVTAADEWLLSALADQTAAPVAHARLSEEVAHMTLLAENARLYEAERVARQEAEAARRDADAANRAKSEFLASMSHELRTPLNAIAGYTELIALGVRGPVTDAQRQDLERIRLSQRHLLSLVNDILNFAKIEAGHVGFTILPVLVEPVLASVGAMVSPQLAAKEIEFTIEDCAANIVVYADEEKLKQILLNLLSNAIKFTPSGGRVVVECHVGPHDIALRVRDTGVGIPSEQLEAIFQPFVQVRATSDALTEGTGLGLSISRHLARAMGGDVAAESVLHRGSVFTLTVPREAAVPA